MRSHSRLLGVTALAAAVLAGSGCATSEPRTETPGGTLYGFAARTGEERGRIEVRGNPCAVVAHDGGLWSIDLGAEGGDGHVEALDPATARATARTNLGRTGPCEATASAGELWIGAGGQLLRQDVRTRAVDVAARLPIGDDELRGVVAVGGALWLVPFVSQVRRFPLPSGPDEAAGPGDGAGARDADGDRTSVWIAERDGGDVVRLDARTGTELARRHVGASAEAVAVGGGSVWVARDGGIVQELDPSLRRVRGSHEVCSAPTELEVAGGSTWVLCELNTGTDSLWRIDARGRSARVAELAGDAYDLAADAGVVWAGVRRGS